MNSATSILDRVISDLDLVLGAEALAGLSPSERSRVLRRAGDALRRVEAVVVETIADLEAVELPEALGCRSMNELLQRALRVDGATAGRFVKASAGARREMNLLSGERLPARWPSLREAMLDGEVGLSGLLAATASLDRAGDRIGIDDRLRADAELADHARGILRREDGAAEPAPPATPDDLRHCAQLIAMYLDPDGSEPTEIRASRRRGLTLGRLQDDGTYPIRGSLLPEVTAQLQAIFDAQLNPKTEGPADLGVRFVPSEQLPNEGSDDVFDDDPLNLLDTRTRAQKQHDAFAAALGIAARHEEMPSLGGAAPTLVVHVDAAELSSLRGAQGASSQPSMPGWASLPGIEMPVAASVAVHTACVGAVQRVLFDEGRIVGINTIDRVFTAPQRRAIVLRDAECLIPGCHVPASWCEIHHVVEHSQGGPTHTDNGVPLCWHHHRTLDRSGWEIRMIEGVPQIRGPAWWDPDQVWRVPRRSRMRGAREPVVA
ncbi:HNH endonuclease signature motif containing protein [Microbacterium sp. XT11]|uniref:HNH endonuclease signature motif containing protein n=1 Tax=Microbacterium sp. XT11 TaxID=367477 RepID=UPI000742F094|nr:HNH endonuclease signature motif containing protein [Microbacterium sp. XT11]ALX66534.1 hypothetical protein AB663_001755 [Microbacterium sp. XT11]